MLDEREWAMAYEKEGLARYYMTPDQRMFADGVCPEQETEEVADLSESQMVEPDSERRTSPGVSCSSLKSTAGSITGVSRTVKEVPL